VLRRTTFASVIDNLAYSNQLLFFATMAVLPKEDAVAAQSPHSKGIIGKQQRKGSRVQRVRDSVSAIAMEYMPSRRKSTALNK
jgi:hypothetical protein